MHDGSWSFNRLHQFGLMNNIWFIIKGGAIVNFIIFSKANAVQPILWINRIINLWLSNHLGLRRVLFLFLGNGLIMSNWILSGRRRCLWWWNTWPITHLIISRNLGHGHKISNAHSQDVLRRIFIISYIT